MLRYFTAGETHGKCLTVIIEGMPSGVEISLDEINEQLAKRQQGYGRGGRMKIEKDTAEILKANTSMAENALRVLGTAYKDTNSESADNAETELIYVGMVGMIDPPRPEVKSAIEK